MSFDRINQYRIMWMFVYYDLPTLTKKQMKAANQFRKDLLRDGFARMQLSIYARHCSSRENAEVHKRRVKNFLPEKGDIMLLEITDAQFARIEFYTGPKTSKRPNTPQQLELF